MFYPVLSNQKKNKAPVHESQKYNIMKKNHHLYQGLILPTVAETELVFDYIALLQCYVFTVTSCVWISLEVMKFDTFQIKDKMPKNKF